jgi:hypothetical protein
MLLTSSYNLYHFYRPNAQKSFTKFSLQGFYITIVIVYHSSGTSAVIVISVSISFSKYIDSVVIFFRLVRRNVMYDINKYAFYLGYKAFGDILNICCI